MTSHRSRLCHFFVDVDDLDQGVAFWSAALDAEEEPRSPRAACTSTGDFASPTAKSDYYSKQLPNDPERQT